MMTWGALKLIAMTVLNLEEMYDTDTIFFNTVSYKAMLVIIGIMENLMIYVIIVFIEVACFFLVTHRIQ